MPAEALTAIVVGVLGFIGTIVGAVWFLASLLGRSIAKFELVGLTQATEITGMKNAIDKLESVVSAVAVDRANFNNLERRTDERFKNHSELLQGLRRDFEELRRGKGRIE